MIEKGDIANGAWDPFDIVAVLDVLNFSPKVICVILPVPLVADNHPGIVLSQELGQKKFQ